DEEAKRIGRRLPEQHLHHRDRRDEHHQDASCRQARDQQNQLDVGAEHGGPPSTANDERAAFSTMPRMAASTPSGPAPITTISAMSRNSVYSKRSRRRPHSGSSVY